jgi:protein-tyrosine phosphatase
MMKLAVLMVCMGNICRSPLAEGAFKRAIEAAGLEGVVRVDSAGTHDYHIGDAPDPRSRATARRHGFDIDGQRGRQVRADDFHAFDFILAMDSENLANLLSIAPPAAKTRPQCLLTYSPRFRNQDVPDPYYGGAQGFEAVLAMIEDAIPELLLAVRDRL